MFEKKFDWLARCCHIVGWNKSQSLLAVLAHEISVCFMMKNAKLWTIYRLSTSESGWVMVEIGKYCVEKYQRASPLLPQVVGPWNCGRFYRRDKLMLQIDEKTWQWRWLACCRSSSYSKCKQLVLNRVFSRIPFREEVQVSNCSLVMRAYLASGERVALPLETGKLDVPQKTLKCQYEKLIL